MHVQAFISTYKDTLSSLTGALRLIGGNLSI